jgi:hypothetical protein
MAANSGTLVSAKRISDNRDFTADYPQSSRAAAPISSLADQKKAVGHAFFLYA